MDTKYTLLNRTHESYEDKKYWSENSVDLKNMSDYRYDYICEEDPLACTSKCEPEELSDESEDEPEIKEETPHKTHPFVCQECNCKFWKKKFYNRHCFKHKKMSNKKDYRGVVPINIIRKTRNFKRKNTNISIEKTTDKVLSVRLPILKAKIKRSSPYPRRDKNDVYPLIYDSLGAIQCSYCPYSSIRKKDLLKHEANVHSGDTPYVCDICPCSFNSSRAFKYHASYFHPDLIKDGVIKQHAALHEPSTVPESLVKRKNFDKSNVTDNRKRNIDLSCCRFSPFKCKDDHNDVKNIPKLSPKPKPVIKGATKRHVDVKKSENAPKKNKVIIVYADELTCSYCPLSFTTLTNRKRHEWIHTGKMPYSCVHCGASFRKNVTLQKHLQKCQPAVPSAPKKSQQLHFCKHCEATFKTKIMLTRHEKKAHPKLPAIHKSPPKKEVSFSCDICDASFKVQSMVDAHKRKAHKKATKVERKKNIKTQPTNHNPHFVNCMEKPDDMIKKEIEVPDMNADVVQNIPIDNTLELNNFYEREVEDFPMTNDVPELNNYCVQEEPQDFSTTDDIPEINSYEQTESIEEFPITDDIPEINSCERSEIIEEFPMTDNVLKLSDPGELSNEVDTVPELNGVEANFTMKKEVVELPEHGVKQDAQDEQLWSEFIVINDDE